MSQLSNVVADATMTIADTGSIDDVLAIVGDGFSVHRAYIFAEHLCNGKQAVSQSNEWCRDGTVPQIDQLQNRVIADIGMQRAMDTLHSGRAFVVSRDTMSPPEVDHLGPQDIESMLCAPILHGDRFWGLLGIDDCALRRSWTDEEISMLKSIASTLGVHMERVELARRAEQSAQELMDATSRLREARSIGHDLNNALTIISNTSGVSADPELAELAGDAIDNASSLVAELRGVAGTPFNPADARTIRNAAQAALLGSATRLELEVEDIPELTLSNSELFRVIDNLVRNASQAMAREGAITVRALTRGNRVTIEIADSGSGIPDSELPKLFYDRYSSNRSGLGLGICRAIVENANGSITIASNLEVGTTVTVLLPVASAA